MTGKLYYLTTLGDWQRHAARFAQSHFIALDAHLASPSLPCVQNQGPVIPNPAAPAIVSRLGSTMNGADGGEGPAVSSSGDPCEPLDPATRILVLVEADEGAHLALEDDPAFEQLPHAFASKPISPGAHDTISSALCHALTSSLASGATTFDAAEAAARVHPLLRPRVF